MTNESGRAYEAFKVYCNRTLYMIFLARMDRDRASKSTVARHTAQARAGEISRWLKRYVARVSTAC